MYKLFTILFLFFISAFANAQNNIFVATNGNDNSGNGSINQPYKTVEKAADVANPSDTIFVRGGTYQNSNFGDGDIWKGQNQSTFYINFIDGAANQYITIKPYNNEIVTVKGDALACILVKNSSYIRVEGFEVYGETENISLDTALAYQFIYKDANDNIQYRVPPGTPTNVIATMTFPVLNNITRPTYFNTSGISVITCHHVDIINNYVHHTPGEGIRSFTSDYLNILENEVHDCSRRSSHGVHGLSVYHLQNIDNLNITKVVIAQNYVHHNYNEVFSWAQSNTIITPHNDEGKGITVQRCSPNHSWTAGKILIENNIAYRNGFSGVHVNTGTGIDIINNTVYHNNQTTLIEGNGNQHGISVQGGDAILIANNIAVADVSIAQNRVINVSSSSTNFTIKNNLAIGNLSANVDAVDVNTLTCLPDFVDVLNFDFALKNTSCAINAADISTASTTDFYNNQRDNSPDLGAIEFGVMTATAFANNHLTTVQIYPNPSRDFIIVEGLEIIHSPIVVMNNLGQVIDCKVEIQSDKVIKVEVYHLPKGIYFIKNEEIVMQFLKM